MIDLQHIRNNINHQVFENACYTELAPYWQTWTKPRNAKLVSIVAIGGGAAGGGNITGGLRGGGGGGSGAITKLIVPANLIPDTLFLLVGQGGVNSSNSFFVDRGLIVGNTSYVCITPQVVSGSVVIQSGNRPARAGGQGDEAGTALGGAGETAFTYDSSSASAFYCALGIFQSTPGARGGDGSTGLASNITALSASILTGGAGGSGNSGASANGASITGVGLIPTIPGGVAGGGSGSIGYQTYRPNDLVSQRVPFLAAGGAGGSSNSTTFNGGNGGNGAIGCGGGGGGAGTSIGGRGGNGGAGVIIITTHF
jgi:hypothetical protein